MDKLKSFINKANAEKSALVNGKEKFTVEELEKARAQKYLQEQKEREEKRAHESEMKRRRIEVAAPSPPPSTDLVVAEGEKVAPIPRVEVIRKLRQVGEPATLFGETEYTRFLRLKALQESGTLDLFVERGRNDFQTELKRNMEEMQKQDIEKKEITEEEKRRLDEESFAKKQLKYDELCDKLEENKFECDEDFVHAFLERIFVAWDMRLMQRTDAERMQPLFRALETKALSGGVLLPICHIVRAMQIQEYVKANDWYIQLAIGNGAWPMGVTMVGIHERTGRERIECGKVAHILNNETQRKYIHGLKRMITECQRLFPTVPSKMCTT